jgi:hypothetical protein|tara:strand:- start:130 stop:339 length:210 start_codon:yes stop_codon:yes gene_type:complete
MNKVFKRLCTECESDDILVDAQIRWIPEDNDWYVECDYDTFTCEACGYEGDSYKLIGEKSLEEKIQEIV